MVDFVDNFLLAKVPNLDSIFRRRGKIVAIFTEGQPGNFARVTI